MRTSRSSAQASAVAVVSWPAMSRVMSSSRSSVSLSGSPSSSRAASSSEKTSSPSAAPGSARRRAISSYRTASASRRTRANRAHGLSRPVRPLVSASSSTRPRVPTLSSSRRSGAPIARRRAGSSSPKTARMITSSVIACISGSAGNARPRGQRAMRSSATSAIVAPYARMRSPWNGGSIMRRWRRCSAPSSRSTEPDPSTGASTMLPSPARSTSGSPENTVLTASGSTVTTSVRPGCGCSVK